MKLEHVLFHTKQFTATFQRGIVTILKYVLFYKFHVASGSSEILK